LGLFAKSAGAEPFGGMRDQKVHAIVARSRFEVKMPKALQLRTTFESLDVEKVCAAVVLGALLEVE